MKFQKLQALGNDLIVFGNPYVNNIPRQDYITRLCDRHYGIGCDYAVYISISKTADYFMHVFNPKGYEVETLGNALRCSAKYVADCGFFKKRSFSVETLSGINDVMINNDDITVEIGKVAIIENSVLNISGVSLPYYYVSVGAPHCVVFLTYGLDDREFNYFGNAIEHHPIFQKEVNVEFACITSNNRIVMRAWERGIGETLSSSDGSCACAAVAQNENLCGNIVQVYQPGGIINVETNDCGSMFITGNCETVFSGIYLHLKHPTE